MAKSITNAKLLAISAMLFLFSSCMNEQDAEYTENQTNSTTVQPQLIASNDNKTTDTKPNTSVDVNLPVANDNRETASAGSEVQFTPAVDKSTKASNLTTPNSAATAKATATTIKETPLKPTIAKSGNDVEKAKALPIEVIKSNPVNNATNPQIVRGVSPSQTRGLGEKPATVSSNAMPIARGAMPVMDHEEYDFGNVPEGTKVVHTFTLKNTGSEDLYIQDVDAGCNCTTTDYTFEAISPGSSTPIKVTFDSNTKVGTQMKNVIISTNNGTKKVRLKGTVFPKDRNY